MLNQKLSCIHSFPVGWYNFTIRFQNGVTVLSQQKKDYLDILFSS